MATSDLEEDLIVSIDEDNIDDFINLTNNFKNWANYFIKDEKEFFIHYSLTMKISKYILKYGIDPNLKDGFNQTALHLSLSNSLCDISSTLIINEEYNFCQDTEGNTEYHKWINHSCINCLKLLNKINPKYNLKNHKGNSVLHQAVIDNNYQALKFLLETCKFNLEDKGEKDFNLLQLCCIYADMVNYINLIKEKL